MIIMITRCVTCYVGMFCCLRQRFVCLLSSWSSLVCGFITCRHEHEPNFILLWIHKGYTCIHKIASGIKYYLSWMKLKGVQSHLRGRNSFWCTRIFLSRTCKASWATRLLLPSSLEYSSLSLSLGIKIHAKTLEANTCSSYKGNVYCYHLGNICVIVLLEKFSISIVNIKTSVRRLPWKTQ